MVASGEGGGGGGAGTRRFRSWFRWSVPAGLARRGRIGRGAPPCQVEDRRVVETAPVLVEGTGGVLDRCPDVQHFAHGLTLAG